MAAAIALASLGAPAEAGAWTRAKGEGLLITSLGGHRLERAATAFSLTKRELAFYVEYGLTDRLTLVGRAAVQDLPGAGEAGEQSVHRIGGVELGVRTPLVRRGRWAGSLQALATVPAAGENWINADFGEGGGDLELRALVGRSVGRSGFVDLQLAYRDRPGGFGSEVRLDLSAGARIRRDLELMVQTYSVWGADEADGPDLRRRYAQHRVQASVIWRVRRHNRIQLSVLETAAAIDVARERALLAALWTEF